MDAITPPTEPLDEDLCSINEAARRLGITPTAIRNRIKRGTLPTRPNGNFGKLVKVPRTVTLTVPLTPGEPARHGAPHPPETVTLTPEEPMTDMVPLTVTLTILTAHIEAMNDVLAKAEAAAERGRLAEAEAAAVPALRDTVAVLKAALDTEQAHNWDLQRERDEWRSQAQRAMHAQVAAPTPADAGGPLYRAWKWMRQAG
jgi:hypothetical protein